MRTTAAAICGIQWGERNVGEEDEDVNPFVVGERGGKKNQGRGRGNGERDGQRGNGSFEASVVTEIVFPMSCDRAQIGMQCVK